MSAGFVVWFTGLSGAGKSTLTALLAAELGRRGVHVETLDGDEVRKELSRGLGFSREDRDANIRRIGFVAKLVSRSGGASIAAAISPYREVRAEIRRSVDRFCEVYCECPISVLAERDPKGLYKKALAGEIKNFTGVDDPYEAPTHPDVHLRTDEERPEASVQKILAWLERAGWVRLGTEGGSAARLLAAHGGDTVDRVARGQGAGELRQRAAAAARLDLTPDASATLWWLASGAWAPLRGFMNAKDWRRASRAGRLETGVAFPIPVTLPCASEIRCGDLALCTTEGIVGLLDATEVFEVESAVPDSIAPGELRHRVGGEVRVLAEVIDRHGLGPEAVRAQLSAASATDVAARVSWSEPSRDDLAAIGHAAAFCDAVVVIGAGLGDEATGAWRRALDGVPGGRFVPAPAWPRGIPDESSFVLAGIVARNYGAGRLILIDTACDSGLAADVTDALQQSVGVAPLWYRTRRDDV